MKHFFCLVIVIPFLAINATAQTIKSNPNKAVQNNAWIMYFGQHTLAEKWKLHTEYQWRRSEYFNYWHQSLLRLGAEYAINPILSGTLGYGWINTYPYGEQPIPGETGEHRAWQQIVLNSKIGRLSIQHRYRLEQRWIERLASAPNGSIVNDGFNYSNRVRYRLIVNMPLNKPSISKGATFISIYDEPFVSWGGAIQNNHLDQNRFYAALGYQYSPDGNIQLGYLNQVLIKTGGISREVNHTLQIAFTHHLDLRPRHLM